MLPQPQAEEDKLATAFSSAAAAIPQSLKAEYEELTLKRERLRGKLERARTELAVLKANGKAP